jgi:small subunit ribosomal protein S1
LTEEQQGGTAPDAEANATVDPKASDEPAGAIAVADEPAPSVDEPTIATEAPADVESSAPVADPATTTDAVSAPADEAAPTDEPAETAPVEEAAPTDDVVAAADATATADTTEAADAIEAADATEAAVAAPVSADATEAAEATDAADAEAGVASAESGPAATDEAAPSATEAPKPAPKKLGPEPTTMEELLAEQDSDIKSFKHGDVVEGNVVRIDKDEILVDIGAKSEGVVSNRELFGRHGEGQAPLAIGDTVLVYVLQPESPEGHAVLSLRRAGLERKWRAMQEQFEAGVIIEAPVIDHNKGGLIVDCGIRGFVPISQIVDFPRRPQNDQPRDAAQEIAEKLQPFVGRKLRLKILEVNRKANRLILSEKVALYEERREKRDELFSSLQVGQKVTGTVRSIAPFGVFIDLGGIDGLVHKSELSWNKVNNPEAGYNVGDEVEAEVIDINHERGRISLSIRRLQPDPWHSTVADFNVGDIIDGTVTKLVNFGAFVRVRDGLEGLIHISELSHQRVAHPGDVVHEGQQLKLKIISLDSERHRLGLSLKQAEEPPARPAPESGQSAPSGGRPERRPRPERSYSMSDAVQEPEGGIDNTLASAFAQVRQQLADAETETVDAPTAETFDSEAVDSPPSAASVEAEAVEAVAELEAAEEAVAAEAIAEVVEAVAADEAAIESAATEELAQLADAAAANDDNEPAAAADAAEVVEAVAEAEAAEEAVAAEAINEVVEAVAADEAALETAAAEVIADAEEAEAAAEEPEADAPVAEADAEEAEAAAEEPEADAPVAEADAEEAEAAAEEAEADAPAGTTPPDTTGSEEAPEKTSEPTADPA